MAGNVSRVRPLRADAVRNRDRVLRVAYETFASEGLTVPVDEIARRAGVGAGTIYRHFPTKEALYAAVVEHRLQEMSDRGRQLLSSGDPGEALFAFLRAMVLEWGASDHVLIDALAGRGSTSTPSPPRRTAPHGRCWASCWPRVSGRVRFEPISVCPSSRRSWRVVRPSACTSRMSPRARRPW